MFIFKLQTKTKRVFCGSTVSTNLILSFNWWFCSSCQTLPVTVVWMFGGRISGWTTGDFRTTLEGKTKRTISDKLSKTLKTPIITVLSVCKTWRDPTSSEWHVFTPSGSFSCFPNLKPRGASVPFDPECGQKQLACVWSWKTDQIHKNWDYFY